MRIIHVPHPSLRTPAKPVQSLDAKVKSIVTELSQTLQDQQNPQGVGLAAPQVDKLWQIFTTFVAPNDDDETRAQLRHFINPQITKKSGKISLGPNRREPVLEGCLSIPGLYGPVPRFEWVEMEFQVVAGDTLQSQQERFTGFAARVMQHELDHLQGILFTDYSLEYDLPVYMENTQTNKLELIDPDILKTF